MADFLASLDKHDLQIIFCAFFFVWIAAMLAFVQVERLWKRWRRK